MKVPVIGRRSCRRDTTGSRRAGAGSVAVVAFALLWCTGTSAESAPSDAANLLTRSIYVPVVFSVDKELGKKLHVFLAESDTEISTRPRTFMFTYYPELGSGFRPAFVELRLLAEGVCSGEDMKTNVLVTPAGLESGEDAVDYDPADLLRQVRARKRDLRVSPVVIRVRCPDASARAESGSSEAVP